jgi:hypothetical protein
MMGRTSSCSNTARQVGFLRFTVQQPPPLLSLMVRRQTKEFFMADGVNIEGLRSLYKLNSIASAFLDHAAQRERDRAETTVERAQSILANEGTEASRGEVVDLFQQLEKLG